MVRLVNRALAPSVQARAKSARTVRAAAAACTLMSGTEVISHSTPRMMGPDGVEPLPRLAIRVFEAALSIGVEADAAGVGTDAASLDQAGEQGIASAGRIAIRPGAIDDQVRLYRLRLAPAARGEDEAKTLA